MTSVDLIPMPGQPDEPDAPIVRIPSRQEVRELVARQHAAKLTAHRRGENISQVGLDQLDQVKQYAAALSVAHGPDASAWFLTTWAEELNAVTAQMERDSAATHATAVQAEASAAQWGGAIGAAVFILVLFLLFRSL